MNTIYVLCHYVENTWATFEIVAWHSAKAVLEAEAERREWDDYRAHIERYGGEAWIKSPDQRSYRSYFIEEVASL